MEEQVERLAQKAWAKFQTIPKSRRLMIAVSGIPGSGKTTLAALVTTRINALHSEQSPGLSRSDGPAAFIPMDGYHLTREQLSAMPDPDSAHARRGADFTFDAPAYLELVKRLRKPLCAETPTIYAPSFDHAVKDPVADDIPIHPSARILVIEGLYLSLGTGASEWKEAAEMMDELWFVEVSMDTAKRRLTARHLEAGLADSEEAAAARAEGNDLVNGRQIIEGRLPVHETIQSVEDSAWAPHSQN